METKTTWKVAVTCAALALARLGWGAPALSSAGVTLSVDEQGRFVTVSYTLENEGAVVTAAFARNGQPLTASETGELVGDVNRAVSVGAHAFRWAPRPSAAASRFAAGELTVTLTLWPTGGEPPYLVADLSGAAGGTRYYASADDLPGGVTNDLYKTEKLVLRRIPAAGQSFQMGSPNGESGRNGDEALHTVSFSADFWLGVYPLTQRQLFLVKGTAGGSVFTSAADASRRPVDSCSFVLARGCSAGESGTVSPENASYLGLLRARTGLDLDLPTEAQWEYAARAGSTGAFWAEIGTIAWYAENAGGETHPVGLKLPNAFGLYDMQGNVRECTLDWYAWTPPSGTDPYTGSGGDVVYRSGGFDQGVSDCRVARRRWVGWANTDSHNGFRVAIRKAVPATAQPVVCTGTLAQSFDAPVGAATASAGCGSAEDPFDSRVATSGVSAGTNYDPDHASGATILIR